MIFGLLKEINIPTFYHQSNQGVMYWYSV